MQPTEPTPSHEWLKKLIGTWTFEHDVPAMGDQPASTLTGTEVFRSIGAYWVQGEATGPMPDGSPSTWQMTLGWDSVKGRFVGAWIGSMMPHLWVYDGELDTSGTKLSLYSEGPRMDGSGGTEPYNDVVEFINDNHRTLTGHTKGPDGQWAAFMTVHYRRR